MTGMIVFELIVCYISKLYGYTGSSNAINSEGAL